MSLLNRNYRQILPQKIEFPEPVKAIVQEAITATKPGRVKYQASYWPAKLYQPQRGINTVKLEKNQPVNVIGREGITLLVVIG